MMDLVSAHTRELLDAGPDAMVIADAHGNIIFANARIEAVFGYRQDELLGLPIEVLLPERYRHRHAGHFGSYVNGPKVRPMGVNLDLYGRRQDGSEFPVEVSLSPLMTQDGLLISSTIRDVTKNKELLQQLQAARQEADRANQAKSAFLAAASHNLRQPLQTLTLLNGVLEKAVIEQMASKAVRIQGEALASVSALLNALLDISKLESGAIRPDVTDCSVQAIFQRLKGTFESQAQAKGLELQVDSEEHIIRTDQGLFEQIIQNLVANAIRYTQRGMVQLRCCHDAAFARIEVMDTGIGIPVGEQDRIFEEFTQLQNKAAQKNEGLGLGLAIVRRMAALLGHTVNVKSELGQGSCFSVIVPTGNQAKICSPQQMVSGLRRQQQSIVMVIDDDPAVASATEMLLDLEGYRVLTAGNQRDAMALIQSERDFPDVMVCDYRLADNVSGIEVISNLRAMTQRSIPAVLVTGDTSSGVTKAIEHLGNCRVVSKPFVSDRFLALVSELITIKQ